MREQKIRKIDKDKIVTCRLNNFKEIKGRVLVNGITDKELFTDRRGKTEFDKAVKMLLKTI